VRHVRPYLLLAAGLLACELAFRALSASADLGQLGSTALPNGCIRYTLCSDQSGTVACTGAGGDQVVIGPLGYVALQLDLEGSAAGVTANLETCRGGHDSCAAGSGAGVDVFPSEVALGQSGQFVGVLESVWVDVSANPSNNADAYLTVCPLVRP
jgi:hypothetical protein